MWMWGWGPCGCPSVPTTSLSLFERYYSLRGPCLGDRYAGCVTTTSIYPIRMPTQRAPLFSCTCIPHLERVVIRGRHDKVSCWTDGTSFHPTSMPTQGAPLFSCTRIPDFERLVPGS